MGRSRGRHPVSYRLQPEGPGTRIFFEHSGFDSQQAFKGAEYGWTLMLERLTQLLTTTAAPSA